MKNRHQEIGQGLCIRSRVQANIDHVVSHLPKHCMLDLLKHAAKWRHVGSYHAYCLKARLPGTLHIRARDQLSDARSEISWQQESALKPKHQQPHQPLEAMTANCAAF